MTLFIKSGNKFRTADEESLDIHNHLPVGNYTIKKDPFDQFYIEQIDSFDLNHRIYGDTIKNTERIISTFQQRPNTTGVLLTGEKGSGKTLLAKSLSVNCAALGIPTIVINTAWHGEEFNTLIQSIQQPCMILFDEFEKVYDRNEQEQILTLLDGVFPSKKLFVLTCNDQWRIDDHMRNRPGRIYYLLSFKGLTLDFIREYCEEILLDKSQIDSVCTFSAMFAEFNFDMLKALTEEMNRYNESAMDAGRMLNAKPAGDSEGEYAIVLRHSNLEIAENQYSPNILSGSPLSRKNRISIDLNSSLSELTGGKSKVVKQVSSLEDDATIPVLGSDSSDTLYFYQNDLIDINATSGTFTYQNKDGVTAIFTRLIKKEFHYAF